MSEINIKACLAGQASSKEHDLNDIKIKFVDFESGSGKKLSRQSMTCFIKEGVDFGRQPEWQGEYRSRGLLKVRYPASGGRKMPMGYKGLTGPCQGHSRLWLHVRTYTMAPGGEQPV